MWMNVTVGIHVDMEEHALTPPADIIVNVPKNIEDKHVLVMYLIYDLSQVYVIL